MDHVTWMAGDFLCESEEHWKGKIHQHLIRDPDLGILGQVEDFANFEVLSNK